jgi:hypothetical protein
MVTREDYGSPISIRKVILFPATFRVKWEYSMEMENTGACITPGPHQSSCRSPPAVYSS